jgi:hypothetical protein
MDRSRARALVPLLLIVVLTAVGTACRATESPAAAPLPRWVIKLVPPPQSSSGGLQVVQVQHALVSPEYVRLIINGTDVTSYATKGPDELDYWGRRGPVPLAPGHYSARVDRMNPVTDGAYAVDSYSWSFTIT